MGETKFGQAAALIQADAENARRYNELRDRASKLGAKVAEIAERLREDPERLFFNDEPHPISAGLMVESFDPAVLDVSEMKKIRQEFEELQRERLRLANELHGLGFKGGFARKEPLRPRRLGL